MLEDGSKIAHGAKHRDFVWKALNWLAVVFYMGFIFYLSAQPQLPDLGRYGVRDWMEHGAEYVILGAMTANAAAITWHCSEIACAGFASALGTGYGFSDEIHQKFVPGRKCDMRDWSADIAGSLLGAGAFLVRIRLKKRRQLNV